ncbi:MAG: aminotransferase class I/II-fold pyridoxal phosphate-dependent enzyme [Rhodospirillales bacterium]|jgi:succinyldiaminopimelate transaminase|nr:aspartate aminotransferase [Rhodospirillaceae bacterium]MDP6428376.1 aminotransferase class I/II-fold pyridoxal phosphate-dependent enzyme [Rhodospirillales bacterium]MDP6642856.1 aminotransferase class I/II-fold pyridoxal phosphate-dependent enzyme [Rhodospirillales bacterium]
MHNDALDRLTDYPFDRLRALLGGLDAPAGLEPVIMSLGEPQHAAPPILAETVAAHAVDWNRYPPIAGTPGLLDAICGWLRRRYTLAAGVISPERNIVAVSGTREALYMAGDISIPRAPGGRRPAVLIPNPFYQVYVGAALMRHADPVYLSATPATGFLPDFAALGPETLARTALAYLCSPANPQGAIADLGYLKKAIELAREYDFVLAADECYAEIYDRAPPPGLLQAAAELGGGLDNLLVFHSLSKRSSAPGLRSGFVAGDETLIQRFKTLRNYGGATLPIPIMAASAALWRDETHVEDNRKLYRRKFDLADQILSGQLGYYRPAGGFYLWLDVGEGEAAAKRLWSEAGVRVIPGGYLARTDADGVNPGAPYVRIALVQTPDTIGDALVRIRDCLV